MKTDEKFKLWISILVLVVIFLASVPTWITEEGARDRFMEISGTTDVVIIRHSNMLPFFGDPNEVTFELEINGEKKSAVCTSGFFSEMVCRIYD